MIGLPATLKQLGDASTAFGETSIGNVSVRVDDNDAPGSFYSAGYGWVAGAGDTLVTLAMIVGAHIKMVVVLTVHPCYYLVLSQVAWRCLVFAPLFAIWAMSQEREMMAWALSNSNGESPLISDEMTLLR